jgi:SAM-dependent methyltransferase
LASGQSGCDADEALGALRKAELGRLPVIDNGDIVGVVTRGHIHRYRELEEGAGGPDVLERLARAPRPPAELATLVGYGSFDLLGLEQLVQLRDLVALEPEDVVLDIGCGVGRTAIPLLAYLTDGAYEGFDPHPESIEWCRREITSRNPGFGFTHLDMRNAAYNPNGAIAVEELVFPYPDDHFDVVFLYSVFTHLLPRHLDRYLSEIARVLKPGGRTLETFFLLNDDSRARLAGLDDPDAAALLSGEAPWASRFEPAEWMVAYDERFAIARHEAVGLKVEQISYGEWIAPGLPPGMGGRQDAVMTRSGDRAGH